MTGEEECQRSFWLLGIVGQFAVRHGVTWSSFEFNRATDSREQVVGRIARSSAAVSSQSVVGRVPCHERRAAASRLC